jgi:hypothetical protein
LRRSLPDDIRREWIVKMGGGLKRVDSIGVDGGSKVGMKKAVNSEESTLKRVESEGVRERRKTKRGQQ